jgi:hypothetical protein
MVLYRHPNPPENTCWSHVQGLIDKRMAFSSGFTKKLEEPYFWLMRLFGEAFQIVM